MIRYQYTFGLALVVVLIGVLFLCSAFSDDLSPDPVQELPCDPNQTEIPEADDANSASDGAGFFPDSLLLIWNV